MSNEFNLTKMTVTQFLAKKAEEEEEERAREKGVGGGPPVYLEDPVRGIPYNGPEFSTGNSSGSEVKLVLRLNITPQNWVSGIRFAINEGKQVFYASANAGRVKVTEASTRKKRYA